MLTLKWPSKLSDASRVLYVIVVMVLLVSMLRTKKTEDRCLKEVSHLRELRNNLSMQLNDMSKRAAILSCENQRDKLKVSEVGGWCEKPEDVKGNSYGHATDESLAKAFANFLKGKRVASFGDGRGHYKAYIDSLNKVQTYDAYDGGPFYDIVSGGKVKYLDLTIPQYNLPAYDWIISLEVAEHIPHKSEAIYLDNIVRHAKEGVILSWAIPGQPGVQHINTKPFRYVTYVFDKLGFDHQESLTKRFRKAASLVHLQFNVAVFKRRDKNAIDMSKL